MIALKLFEYGHCVEMNLFLMCSTRCYSIIVPNCTFCFFSGADSKKVPTSFRHSIQSVLSANIVLSAIVSLKLLQHCLKLFEPSWNCSELRISTRRIIFTPLFLWLRRCTGCCKLLNKNDFFRSWFGPNLINKSIQMHSFSTTA